MMVNTRLIIFTFLLNAIILLFPIINIAHALMTNDEYKLFLDSLNTTSASSISKARDTLLREFENRPTAISEDALRKFHGFYEKTVWNLDKGFNNRKDLQFALHDLTVSIKVKITDPTPLKTIRNNLSSIPSELLLKHQKALDELIQYEKSGVGFSESEGTWYLETASDFILSLASRFKGGYADYLSFLAIENRERIIEDAGLIVDWETVRKRIVRWEKFAEKYPSLPETKTKVEKELSGLVNIYLYGLDNTPVNYKSEETKKSWYRFLGENNNSRFYQNVKKRYDELISLEPKEDVAFNLIVKKINEASSGDIIEINTGIYNVDKLQGLLVRNKENIILKSANGEVAFYSEKPDVNIIRLINCKNIVIDGFKIYHSVKTECFADCISIGNSENIIIRNNDIHGSGAYGVHTWGKNKNIKITDNNIHNCSYWGVELFSDGGEVSSNTFYENGEKNNNIRISENHTNIIQKNNLFK